MEIDINKMLNSIWRFWWIVVLTAFVFASSAFVITKTFIEEKFVASATMYVWNDDKGNTGIQGSTSLSDISSSRTLATTYIYVLQSYNVAEVIAQQLNLKYTPAEIQNMMSVSTVNNTEIIKVSATSTSPEEAAAIANAAVEYGGPKIIEIVKAGSVKVVDYAKVPEKSSYPNCIKTAMTSGVIGALLAALIISLISYFDIKIKTLDDIISLNGENEDIPVIAIIPKLDMTQASYNKYYKNTYYKKYDDSYSS